MMERKIEFDPGFDKRHTDPDKNYGIGGVIIRFVLIGELGATYLCMNTDWYPPATQKEYHNKFPPSDYFSMKPGGYGFGYHSPTPQYDDQQESQKACEYLGGKPCYSDTSFTYADIVIEAFLNIGIDAVWSELGTDYVERFGELK